MIAGLLVRIRWNSSPVVRIEEVMAALNRIEAPAIFPEQS